MSACGVCTGSVQVNKRGGEEEKRNGRTQVSEKVKREGEKELRGLRVVVGVNSGKSVQVDSVASVVR